MKRNNYLKHLVEKHIWQRIIFGSISVCYIFISTLIPFLCTSRSSSFSNLELFTASKYYRTIITIVVLKQIRRPKKKLSCYSFINRTQEPKLHNGVHKPLNYPVSVRCNPVIICIEKARISYETQFRFIIFLRQFQFFK